MRTKFKRGDRVIVKTFTEVPGIHGPRVVESTAKGMLTMYKGGPSRNWQIRMDSGVYVSRHVDNITLDSVSENTNLLKKAMGL